MRTALAWGCPFALYWELYNNELGSDGSQSGFWMVDHLNVRQPIFETHRTYYVWARQFVAETFSKTAKLPSSLEFRKAAVAFLDQLPTETRQ
jgi:hypothetical protein